MVVEELRTKNQQQTTASPIPMYSRRPIDGTFLPKSSAALSGLRLRLSLPRIFRDAWLTALPARQAVPPRWGYLW